MGVARENRPVRKRLRSFGRGFGVATRSFKRVCRRTKKSSEDPLKEFRLVPINSFVQAPFRRFFHFLHERHVYLPAGHGPPLDGVPAGSRVPAGRRVLVHYENRNDQSSRRHRDVPGSGLTAKQFSTVFEAHFPPEVGFLLPRQQNPSFRETEPKTLVLSQSHLRLHRSRPGRPG